MTKEQIRVIADAMMNKVHLVEHFKNNDEFIGNIRKCPFYSELKGMELMLKMMGIEFEYGFDENINIVSLTIGDYTAI